MPTTDPIKDPTHNTQLRIRVVKAVHQSGDTARHRWRAYYRHGTFPEGSGYGSTA
jgi:hypothetical protein